MTIFLITVWVIKLSEVDGVCSNSLNPNKTKSKKSFQKYNCTSAKLLVLYGLRFSTTGSAKYLSFLESALKKTTQYFLKFLFLFESTILTVNNGISFKWLLRSFVQHDLITIAIDCNGLSLLIFEAKWPNYAYGPKSAPNSDLFWVPRISMYACGFSVPQMRQFCLFTNPPISKWASSENLFFFLPKSSSSISQSQAYFPALFKRIHHHIRSAEG